MNSNGNERRSIIYVVDNDPAACQALCQLIYSFGYQVRSFESPAAFLDQVDDSRPGCVVLDLRMPEVDGMEVHRQLGARGIPLSVIMLMACAETRTTVCSLRKGAVAVLDKPFKDEELWSFIQEGLQVSEHEFERREYLVSLENRFKRLARQDREVLRLMMEGVKNRTIAKQLDVSLRTVENRRRRVFEVMQAGSVAQLSRMVTQYEHGVAPDPGVQNSWLGLPHV